MIDFSRRAKRRSAEREIVAALLRYVRGVDRLDAGLILSAFHTDARLEYGTFSGDPAELADWLMERMPRRYTSTHHQLGNITVDFSHDSTRAAATESYLTAHHVVRDMPQPAVRVFGGRYLDRFEQRDGAWRIVERALVRDWDYTVATVEQDGFASFPHVADGRGEPPAAADPARRPLKIASAIEKPLR